MVLATAKIGDFDQFWNTFSTKGAEKRKQHGSKGATVFRDPNESDRVWAIFDWDEAGWQSFTSDPEVPAIFQEAGFTQGSAQVGGVPPRARRLAPDSNRLEQRSRKQWVRAPAQPRPERAPFRSRRRIRQNMTNRKDIASVAAQLAELTRTVEAMAEDLKAMTERADRQQTRSDNQETRADNQQTRADNQQRALTTSKASLPARTTSR